MTSQNITTQIWVASAHHQYGIMCLFLRHHLAGEALVASQNVSCFLRLTRDMRAYITSLKLSRKGFSSLQVSLDNPPGS